MEDTLADQKKTVLVTGATRGIGLALVELYMKSGWNVIATARNLDKADKLKALAPTKLVQLDAGDEASILAAAKELGGEPIDLLINNAGIGNYESLETTTKASLMEQLEVNTVGPFLVTRAFLPNLRAAVAKHGSAVVGNMSSIVASITDYVGSGNYGYRSSKTALNMINASLALDLKKDKIIAVALHPGYVVTDMTRHKGDIQPEESVAGLKKVLAEVKEADSGRFIGIDGVSLPW